jgi:hypothetical protein
VTMFPDITPGDTVALPVHRWATLCGYRSLVVDRVTKTQIITDGGKKWRRDSGREVGGGEWHADHILPWTVELRAEADGLRRIHTAYRACAAAATRLNNARGDEAIRLAALLTDEMKEPKP